MSLEKLRIDRSGASRRRRGRSPWIARAVLLLVIVALLFVFRRPLLGFVDRFTLTEVEVARASAPRSAADAVRGKAANGYVVAARRAALSADTPGRIVEMRVTEGSVVKAGDVVARLYSEEQEAAVAVAKAEVAVARDGLRRSEAALVAMRADLEQAQRQEEAARSRRDSAVSSLTLRTSELERARRLSQSDVVTRSELDDAQSAHDVAKAERDSAESAVRAAEAAVTSVASRVRVAELDQSIAAGRVAVAEATLARAEATLDKTTVRAPFDGIVVLKDAEVGEVVSPNSQGGSNARGSVVTMVDFASLEVQADVPETSLEAVKKGAPVSIFLDAYRDRKYAGRVSRIWPTADRQKGTVEVRVTFDEPDDRLRPEMGVRVVFLAEEETAETEEKPVQGVLVPGNAVVKAGGRSGVFVVEQDRVAYREVTVGARVADRVAVTAGVEEGERVVVGPPSSLADGDRIRVRE